MEVKGRVFKVMPEQSGVSANGKNWLKSTFIIETLGEYQDKISFDVMTEKLSPLVKGLKTGEEITVHFNVKSREYQDKWFTNVTAWKIDKANVGITNEVKTEVKEEIENLPF